MKENDRQKGRQECFIGNLSHEQRETWQATW
jgi:hypothetical protein